MIDDYIKSLFPDATDEELYHFFWCGTSFPAGDEDHIKKMAEEAAIRSGNNITLAIHQAYEDFEETMDRCRIHDLMIEYLQKCQSTSAKCLELATLNMGYDSLTKEEVEASPIVFVDCCTSGLGLINGYMDHINMPRIIFIKDTEGKILEIK
jgi:hypothetical protein